MGEAQTVAVIGAGFSGLLTALRLLLAPSPPRVILIERGPRFGRGAAYSTTSPHHLLNVRARNMSAFAEQPDHFLAWLRTVSAAGADEGALFVTRDRYGQYLQSLLREATRADGPRLVLEHDAASELEHGEDGWRVRLSVGRTVEADVVVLAMGNLPPPPVVAVEEALIRRGLYVRDPWAWDAAATPAQGDILLLGSGLTAVDIALSIHGQRPEAAILALSRHGLSPRRHAETAHGQVAPPQGSPLAVFRQVRAAARGDWRRAIDELRPHVQPLWRRWSLAERRAFLRHLRPWWDVVRHRLAPAVAERMEAQADRGLYHVVAGRLEGLRAVPGGVEAAWRARGAEGLTRRAFALAINCTGPRGDVASSEDALVRALLAAGLIRPDACQLGIDVDAGSRVVGADGTANPDLFAVGPLTRGQFYEITSVPDVRIQAADCAAAVLERLRAAPRVQLTPAVARAGLLAECADYIAATMAELDVELAGLKYSRRMRNAWELRGRRAALAEMARWLDAQRTASPSR